MVRYAGYIVLIITIIRLIYVIVWMIKNWGKEHRPLFVFSQKKYKNAIFINVENFNHSILLQNFLMILLGAILSIISILTNDNEIFIFACIIVACINITFNTKRKKYIKKY